jgi:hypothetical protein
MNHRTSVAVFAGLLFGLTTSAFGQTTIPASDVPLLPRLGSVEDGPPGIVSVGRPEDDPAAERNRWFAEVDLGAAWTQVGLGVYGPPNPELSRLGWGGLPQAELGYRFDFGGSVLFHFSYLGDAVNASSPGPYGETRATFTTQTYAVDYRSSIYGSRWATIQWQGGLRIGALGYTTHDLWTDGATTDFQFRREIVAAGPHIGLRPALHLADTGLEFFTLVDGAALTGIETHTYQEVTTGGVAPGAGSEEERALAAVLQLNGEAGLSYTLPGAAGLRIALGYKVESSFWDGHSFTSQGPFLRLGVGF